MIQRKTGQMHYWILEDQKGCIQGIASGVIWYFRYIARKL